MDLADYFRVALIALSFVIIALVMVQVRGGGFGDMFGGSDLYRTRRGVEKTIFDMTAVFAGLFLLVAFLTAYFS